MSIKGKLRQYFPGSNSSQGFYSLWDSNINDLERLIIIKGGPGTGKSSLMRKIADSMIDLGHDTEFLWCSSDAESLDGVVFRNISLGIVDGTAPHTRDPRYPGVVDKIINLGDYWNEKILLEKKSKIIHLTNLNKDLFAQTYRIMALAKKYHDDLEGLYIAGMDWEKVDVMTQDLISQFFEGYPDKNGGIERHRFAGASTPQGPVNYLDELLADAKSSYIIKGRAGTGKSTMTKKIAKAARKKGFDVEYYHCSFDPNSVDNILIPELGICFIDGTPPHEKIPGPKDRVIDMFNYMSQDVYKKEYSKIKEIDELYQNTFAKSFNTLRECKMVHDELEKLYIDAMDFSKVNQVTDKLLKEILEYES